MAHATKESTVTLVMSEEEARFLRTLLGSLSPHDFSTDHVVFNLIRKQHPNYLVNNSNIAGALLALLGSGLGRRRTMNTEEIRDLANRVEFEHHPSLVVTLGGRDWDNPEYLQLRDSALDPAFNSGRKWRMSSWMTKSEVVQTIWAAYEAWVIHEARESFKYRGVSIFGPHFDVDALVEIADRIEVRT